MEGTTTIFDLYNNMTIPGIIVDAVTTLTSGLVGSIRNGFDALVLNDAKTGLSMLAIWSLTTLGVGFVWKNVPKIIGFFRRSRA